MDVNEYPIKYIIPIQLENGTLIQLRPIHPNDKEQGKIFRTSLSSASIYARFNGYVDVDSEKMAQKLTEINYSKEMAIVAEVIELDIKRAIAVARIARNSDNSAEFAIIISDLWQGRQIGSLLTEYMIFIAKDMGFNAINALVSSENGPMLAILKKKGFEFRKSGMMAVEASLKFNVV